MCITFGVFSASISSCCFGWERCHTMSYWIITAVTNSCTAHFRLDIIAITVFRPPIQRFSLVIYELKVTTDITAINISLYYVVVVVDAVIIMNIVGIIIIILMSQHTHLLGFEAKLWKETER